MLASPILYMYIIFSRSLVFLEMIAGIVLSALGYIDIIKCLGSTLKVTIFLLDLNAVSFYPVLSICRLGGIWIL